MDDQLDARDLVTQHLESAASALHRLLGNDVTLARIAGAATLMAECIQHGGTIYTCGNGGSMCDAMHLAEELSGRYRDDRRPYPALAISDVGHITCTANDFGYASVFSRFIEGHGGSGDLLVALSTSGASPNILAAAETARAQDMTVIALTGRADSALGASSTIEVCVDAGPHSDRAQELHIKVIHAMIGIIERTLGDATAP